MTARQQAGPSESEDGQRAGGHPFKQKWWTFCDQGWAGIRDYDPSHHAPETLAQFAQMTTFEYGMESWFRKHFPDLPDLPPAPPMPPMPPGGPGRPWETAPGSARAGSCRSAPLHNAHT